MTKGRIKMRNIANLFKKIRSFEIVTLHTSGMRHVTDYEIVMKGDEAEVSQYAIGYRDGEEVRQLQKRALCPAERALKLMNKCSLLSWDGYHGNRPKGIKDGTNFIFKAIVNGGKEIYATGSQRFPLHYSDFKEGLYEILKKGS
ncbi:MAG: hypothetical protein IJS71_03555 [Clostridia bacterium]|nr:hypothetical protein [Clostridia bacterium]